MSRIRPPRAIERNLAGRLGPAAWWVSILLAHVVSAQTPANDQADPPAAASADLPAAVRTIFESRCLECHDDAERAGGLSLATAAGIQQGGASGPVLDLQQPTASRLLQMVRGPQAEMPQTGRSLSAEEIEALQSWVRRGTPWPPGLRLTANTTYDREWWSLHPLGQPVLPAWPASFKEPPPANPIDRFVRLKLREHQLELSPPAEPSTLLRRVYFDLVGLPPPPEVVERFATEPEPGAYERLVDELLASPHYGERWARHWLDVVHYADSHGFDKDKPREFAWPYRDYVIASFNRDLPWSEFIRQQIAGDALDPNDPAHLAALGFLAAGPWDFIGHEELPETKIDGKIARHLDRDDMVRTAVQSFCSLTVGCAQCHDHKFDPISQRDYYQLQAVFAAVDRTNLKYDTDPARHRQRAAWLAAQRQARAELSQLEEATRQRGGEAYQQLEQRRAELQTGPGANPTAAFGYHSQLSDSAEVEKWVLLDLGASHTLQQIVVRPAYDDFNQIGAGFGFPIRFCVEVADEPAFTSPHCVADNLQADFANPGLEPLEIAVDRGGRYIRLRATRLASRLPTDFNLALAEIEVFDQAGVNLARQATVTALDSIEAPPRWQRTNLIDGEFPRGTASDLAAVTSELAAMRIRLLTPAELADWEQLHQQLTTLDQQLAALPPPEEVYAAAVHTGSGNFVGTGGSGGRPRPIHLLERGNVTRPGPEVGPAALQVLPDWPGEFSLPADHPEAARRLALANWIAAPQNHLTWRSVVNRVWQYHFGAGLVDSPDDFGRMGQLPSHPELLDWLAADFRDQGQSLKRLHRLIVTSATYRQASAVDPRDPRCAAALAVDANNRWLWRMNRRKLEAEAVRDSILAVSGQLDLRSGGPGFRDFVIEHPEHSPHYRYDLADPDAPELKRRSIYRFVVRSQLQPLLTTLDCADPSIQIGKRNESTTPLQSLVLLNDGLVLTMSRHFAERLATATANPAEQTKLAWQWGLARAPTPTEAAAVTRFIASEGLENLARLIFNLNEFTFVD